MSSSPSKPSDLVTAGDVVLMQGLAQRLVAIRPDLVNPGASYGGLAWIWGKGHGSAGNSWRRALWFAETPSGKELVAWVWAALPRWVRSSDGSVRKVEDASVTFQVHPDHAELVDKVIGWFADVAPDVDRRVVMTDTDKDMVARWAEFGYRPDSAAAGEWTRLNERGLGERDSGERDLGERRLDDLAKPILPEGYRFRTAAEVPAAAVARAHLDAWHPSTYSVEAYQGVRTAAGYREDLHFLVEAPDGTMAASTIVWLDEANRTAEFEPVGTHPRFRRRGLGRALLLHGMGAARDAGAGQMTVACLGAPGNAALRLYEGLGFRAISRDTALVRRMAG
ncbi:ribosomal protein S18 acetylase RimI-like enzyme [Catenulispora sp. EB89]|uniref:GNAT family N-acetyltransferase n=1 Tax=Catenulispora sp. EB89 TaxID=3156257 RepID=UPI003515E980